MCHLKANHETIISKAHNFVLYSTSCEMMVDEKKIGENGFAKMGRSAGGCRSNWSRKKIARSAQHRMPESVIIGPVSALMQICGSMSR